jgi:pilus assembly protein CpaB
MGGVSPFRRPRSPVHLLRQVAAAALACLALVLALRSPPPAAGAGPGRPTVPVAVAAADLPAGTVLTTADLATAALPADAAPAGAASAPDALAGRVLAAPVRAGEAVTDVRVVGPGLWSQVPDGQVAAPVRLADLAVATLLRAGDRVDVLAAAGDGRTASIEVVAEGALVLTVPTTTTDDAPATGAPGGSGLLVLAVAPETAQRLAAAGVADTLTVTLGRP